MSEEETQVEETEEKSSSEDSDDGGKLQMDDPKIDEQMKEVEENPPDRLEDWPDGPAKYRTIGGGDASEEWEEGPTKNLGPSDVRYYDDGSVTVKGDKVDNPDDYKGEPIPGGPTDPDAPDDPSGLQDDDEKDGGDGHAAEGADATDAGDESRSTDTHDPEKLSERGGP